MTGRTFRHNFNPACRAGIGRIGAIATGAVALIFAGACTTVANPPAASPAHEVSAGQGGGGVPNFSVNTATTGGASSAIQWAESYEVGGANFASSPPYAGFCLAFVANAYGARNSYPYNTAWDLAQALKLQDPSNPAAAPAGALMFFGPNSYNQGDGHVGISLGGGAMISANEPSSGTGPNVVEDYPTPNVQSSEYWFDLYRGWAWPPTSWGPLAEEATPPAAPPATAPPDTVSGTQALQPASGGLQVGGSQSVQPASGTTGLQPAAGSSQLQQPGGTVVIAGGSGSGGGSQPPTGGSGSGPTGGSGSGPTGNTGNPNTGPTGTSGSGPTGGTGSGPTGNSGSSPATYPEATGYGPVNTWSNPNGPTGTEGPQLPSNTVVQVVCYVTATPEGPGQDPYWYEIAGSGDFGSADAFCDEGATTCPGGFSGTPLLDQSVPQC